MIQALRDIRRTFARLFNGDRPEKMTHDEFLRGWALIPFPEKVAWIAMYGLALAGLVATVLLVWSWY